MFCQQLWCCFFYFVKCPRHFVKIWWNFFFLMLRLKSIRQLWVVSKNKCTHNGKQIIIYCLLYFLSCLLFYYVVFKGVTNCSLSLRRGHTCIDYDVTIMNHEVGHLLLWKNSICYIHRIRIQLLNFTIGSACLCPHVKALALRSEVAWHLSLN